MSTEPLPSILTAELALKSDIRRAKLLDKAKGRGRFSWLDWVFLLPAAGFVYVAFSGEGKLQRETLALVMALTMIVQWSVMRLSIRLSSLVQYLLEQPQTHEAQQGAPEGCAASDAPLS